MEEKREENEWPVCEYCGQPMTKVLNLGIWYWSCENEDCKFNIYMMDPQPDQQKK